MLNKFYYLCEQGIGAAKPPDKDIVVTHVVDGRPGQIEQLLQYQYSPNGNYPFCLALRGTGDPVALIRQAMLFLFHPTYVMGERGRPVFLERTDHGCRAALEAIFHEQRLAVELIAIGEVRILDAGSANAANDYYRYCLTNYAPGDVFLLNGGDAEVWSSSLSRVDAALLRKDARFHRLAASARESNMLAVTQQKEIGRLKEEGKIIQELLDLRNKHDEVNYILRFYRNEYEILPLWYKRIGHIVKVLQGKRSFRSLFDKSVKKYKD